MLHVLGLDAVGFENGRVYAARARQILLGIMGTIRHRVGWRTNTRLEA